jgi:hypothetical protein
MKVMIGILRSLSHLHQAQRFTVAFRRRHTKVATIFSLVSRPF